MTAARLLRRGDILVLASEVGHVVALCNRDGVLVREVIDLEAPA